MGVVPHGRAPPHGSYMVVRLLRTIYTGADLGLSVNLFKDVFREGERGGSGKEGRGGAPQFGWHCRKT